MWCGVARERRSVSNLRLTSPRNLNTANATLQYIFLAKGLSIREKRVRLDSCLENISVPRTRTPLRPPKSILHSTNQKLRYTHLFKLPTMTISRTNSFRRYQRLPYAIHPNTSVKFMITHCQIDR